jgi:preprotein translocase subunit SecE
VSKVRTYIEETVNELTNKVTWPTWQELQSSSIVVLIASVIIALLIFVMDFVFGIQNWDWWKGILGYFYEFLG